MKVSQRDNDNIIIFGGEDGYYNTFIFHIHKEIIFPLESSPINGEVHLLAYDFKTTAVYGVMLFDNSDQEEGLNDQSN